MTNDLSNLEPAGLQSDSVSQAATQTERPLATGETRSEHRDATPHVLYIAGESRSGSTLLGRMFGALPGFVNVGELRYIWRRGMSEGQLCGCGSPLPECSFWRKVLVQAFPDLDAIGLAALAKVQDSVDRPDRFLKTNPTSLDERSVDVLADEYRNNLSQLMHGIHNASGGCVIVDSSKSPTYGKFLTQLAGVRVSILHLVRDCRAVSFSTGRKKRWVTANDKGVQWMQGRPVRNAIRWNVTNYLCKQLKAQSDDYSFLRYEDFVAEPNESLRRVLSELHMGEHVANVQFVNGETELGLSCTVSGNPDRFQSGPLNIKIDDEWRTKTPWWKRGLLTACGLPYLISYGYLGKRAAVAAPCVETEQREVTAT